MNGVLYEDCTYDIGACRDNLELIKLFLNSTPYKPDWSKPWEILTGKGDLDYLVLEPEDVTRALLGNDSSGAFYWETEYDVAAESAFNYYVSSTLVLFSFAHQTYLSRIRKELTSMEDSSISFQRK